MDAILKELNLNKDMTREDAARNRAVVGKLVAAGPPAVEHLVGRLAASGDPAAQVALHAVADHPDPYARADVAGAIQAVQE